MKKTPYTKVSLLITVFLLLSVITPVVAQPEKSPVFSAPVINPPGLIDQTGTEATPLTSYSFAMTDIFLDNDGDGYSIATLEAFLWEGGQYKLLPAWLSFSESPPGSKNYTFSGTPSVGSAGVYTLRVVAYDGPDSAYDEFTYTILPLNHAPVVTNPIVDRSLNDNETFNFSFPADTFEDEDGDPLTYTARQSDNTALPSWLTFNQATRTFYGTVPNGVSGSITVRVTARDTSNASVYDDFVLTLVDVNYPPVLVNPIADRTATQDVPFSFQFSPIVFSDTDGDVLSYSATLTDGTALTSTWLSFAPSTRTFSGTPADSDVGVWNIRVTAFDGLASTTNDFSITVLNVNDPPVVSVPIPDQNTDEDLPFSFPIPSGTFEDVDGDELTYSARLQDGSLLSTTGWLSFSVDTFSGTPDNSQVGTYPVVVTASDGNGGSVDDLFLIIVDNVNDAPIPGSIADRTLEDNEVFNFNFGESTFTDPDGDTLSYSSDLSDGSPLPGWLLFDGPTRTFSGTVPNGMEEVLSVRVTATDDGIPALSANSLFSITIQDNNDDPQIDQGIAGQTTPEDSLFNFPIPSNAFYDPDGDSLTYSASLADDSPLENTGWLSFDGSAFSGTPLNEHVGAYMLKVSAADAGGAATAVEITFELTVTNVNDVPVVDNPLPDQTATEDSAFEWIVPANTFSDPDGDPLTCSAQWKNAFDVWGAVDIVPSESLWVSFNPATCTFSGTPDNDDVFPDNTWEMRVTVSDEPSHTQAFDEFTITVNNVNDAPHINLPLSDQSVVEETPFDISTNAALYFGDVDGDSLSYSAYQMPGEAALPAWLNFSYDGTDLNFSGTPPLDYADSFIVKVVADDGLLNIADEFEFSVSNVNDAPQTDQLIPDQNTDEDIAYLYQIPADAFTDPDLPYDPQEVISYTLTLDDGSPIPGWLSFDPVTRQLSGTPANADVGILNLRVTATDRLLLTASQDFSLTVVNVNDDPEVYQGIANQSINEDDLFSLPIPVDAFLDQDGDLLTYSATLVDDSPLSSTGWLSFDGSVFSGTPLNEHVGSYMIKVSAADGGGAATAAVTTFNITVNNTNDAPLVDQSIPDQSTDEDVLFLYEVPSDAFTDPDLVNDPGEALSFTAALEDGSLLPGWLSFNSGDQEFTGTPTNADVGSLSIRVTVTDATLLSTSQVFSLTVNNINDAPVVAHEVATQDVVEDSAFSYLLPAITFSDDDLIHGDSLTLSVTLADGSPIDLPEPEIDPFWLDYEPATGTFSGTPLNDDAIVGSYDIKVTAADLAGATVDEIFTIQVANTNDAPAVAAGISNQSTDEDVSFSYTIPGSAFLDIDPDTTTDPETGDSWTFSAVEAGQASLPAWLTLSGDTFTGTPINEQVGSYDIEVTITDSDAQSATTSFTITVDNVNDTPTAGVLGAVPVADEDSLYTFTIQQTLFDDDDFIHGDTLTYSAVQADNSALPGWLNFNVDDMNGQLILSGTPLMANIGTLSMKVVATDQSNARVEVPFDIIVNAVNDAPLVPNPIPDRSTFEDNVFSYQLAPNTFSDEEDDELTYTAFLVLNPGQAGESTTNLPAWLSFNDSTRIFSGTPTNDDVGVITLRVVVTDDGVPNESGYDDFVLTVINTNDAPKLDHPVSDQTIDEDDTASYCIPANTFSDEDGDTLTYEIREADETAPPDWIVVDNSSVNCAGMPEVSFSPQNADVGVVYLKISIDDGNGGKNSDLFSITAVNTNDAPYLANAIPDFSHDEDALLDFSIPTNTFGDDDIIHGDSHTYSAQHVLNPGQPSETTTILPDWLSLNVDTFTGTPDWDDVEDITIRLTATDDYGSTASTDFTISLNMVNDVPIATGAYPNQSATEDIFFSLDLDDVPPATLQWTDEEDDLAMLDLVLSADLADDEPLPAWLSFDPGTKLFSGTPLNDDSNQTLTVRITATDSDGGSTNTSFDLQVIFVNDPPVQVRSIPDKITTEDQVFSYQVPATVSTAIFTDEESDPLTYSAALSNGDPLPAWLTFTPSSRLFTGTPANGDVAVYEVVVTAKDPDDRTVSDTFNIQVNNSNDKPVLQIPIPNQTFAESDSFNYTFPEDTFRDEDTGDTLTYTATLVDGNPLPAWLTFTPATRTFTTAANSADQGQYFIQVTATDDGSPPLSENAVFDLTVTDIPETISVENPISDQTTNEDSEYQFTVLQNTFLHGDGYPMTYSAELVAVNGSALDPFIQLTTSTAGTWLYARTDNVDTIYIYGVPNNSHVGTFTIRVTAQDDYGNSNYDEYVLEVINVNDYPSINAAVGNQTATEDVAFSLDVSTLFTDIDVGDSYVIDTISVSGIGSYPIDHVTPGETSIDLGGGDTFWLAYNNDYNNNGELVFSGTPENDDVYDSQGGRYTITLTAKDTHGATRAYSFLLAISPVNDAPTLGGAIPNKTVTCGYDLYHIVPTTAWVDVDEDDTFTFTATIDGSPSLPAWLTFDSAARYFHGTPTSAATPEACGAAVPEGTTTVYDMLVEVTDSGGESLVLDPFTFSVYKPISGGTGSLMYITTDDSYFSDLTIYEDCVLPNSDPDPNCSFNLPADAFQNFTRITTSDPWVRDDSQLAYSVTTVAGGLPGWIVPDGASGSDTSAPYDDPLHLTFSPGDYDPGVYYLYFSVTNPESDFRDNVMKLTVLNTNDAPTIADGVSDRSATEEYSFEYVFTESTFNDIDEEDSLTYSAELVVGGVPEAIPGDHWLKFSAADRRFYGVPTNDDVTRNTVGSIIYDSDPITVRVTATDESGESISDDFTIVVNNNQDYPYVDTTVLSTFSNLTVDESDSTWDFTIPDDVCKDVDQPYNDTLSYDTVQLLDGSPLSATGWLTYDAGTRTFDGTPEYEHVGNHFIRVYCKDLTNRTANFYFTISVENVNDHPIVANPISDVPKNAYEDTSLYYQAPATTFSDEEDNDLIYSAYLISGGVPTSLPDWLSFDSATRFFSSEDTSTPGNEDVGLYQIRLCAEEDLPLSENPGTVCEDFYIRVNNANDVPLVDASYPLPDQSTNEDSPYSYQINQDAVHPTFYDIDIGDSLTFTATLADGSPLPGWLTLSGDTLSGTPANEDVGVYYVKVIATDTGGDSTSDIYILTVVNVNDAPTVANPVVDQVATEDQLFTYTVPLVNAAISPLFEDVDNSVYPAETHTFFACDGSSACACDGSSPLAGWLNFTERILSATPNYTEQGHYDISITVCDAGNAYAHDVFDLEVVLANDAPLVANPIPDQSTPEDSSFSFTFASNTFSDEEGDTLTYEAFQQDSAVLPAWLQFNPATRNFSSIADRPDYMDIGSVAIVVRATDPSSDLVEDTFNLEVTPVNDTPRLNQSIPNRSVYEEATDSYQISSNTFIDEENDHLTYSLTMSTGDPLPTWITFNPVTRIMEARPLNEHADQTYMLRLTVTDDGIPNRSNSTTFNIITFDVNDAPTVNDPLDDLLIIEDDITHFIIPDGSGADPAVFLEIDNNDTLTYSATLSNDTPLPGWVVFDPATREFVFSPTNDHVGISKAILIKVTATDNHGSSAADIFKVTVQNVNDTPIRDGAISLNNQNATEDSLFSMSINAGTFYDIDPGDSITYSATLLDDSPLSTTGWLSFSPATRTFSGTPRNEHVGTIAIKLIATDQSGAANNTNFDSFTITTANTNDGPTVANPIPGQTATEDIPFSFTFSVDTFNDVDAVYGDVLTYSAVENGETSLPGWLLFDNSTRTFSGTPTNDDTQTYTIQVSASDGEQSISTNFNIVVTPVNDPPHDLQLSANEIDENLAVGTDIGLLSASDIDNTTGFVYSLIDGAVDNSQFSITGNRLRSAVAFNYELDHNYTVDVQVSDTDGLTYHELFNVIVHDVNETPQLSGESISLDEGGLFNSLNLLDNDSDPDPADSILVNRIVNDVDHGSLSFDPDGSFSYTHDSSETISDSFIYEVCDDGTPILCATASVVITINPVNDNPQRNGAILLNDQTAYEDTPFSLSILANTFTDAEDASLTYSALEDGQASLPGWLSFDSDTRVFFGTPAQSDLGIYTIRLTASDTEGLNASDTFDITVLNTNDIPYVVNPIPDQSATEDVLFSYQFPSDSFNDIDPGDTLTYSAVESGHASLPAWLSLDAGTRTFSGTPGNDEIGTWQITVTATDNSGTTATDSFSIVVSNVNDAPYLANPIPDQTANEDIAFSYQFPVNTFADIDVGDTFIYSAVEDGQASLPAWLSFDAGTRTFSGTPGNSEVGVWQITVTAEDSEFAVVTDTFEIVVSNVNDAPYLVTPIPDQTATEDVLFTFQFAANTFNDIDVGDTLTYSAVQNGQASLPGWLGFDAGTRTFSGTPGNSEVGVWQIAVTVTDTHGASATDTFEITVSNVNDLPTVDAGIADQVAYEDSPFLFVVPGNAFADQDPGDSLTYEAVADAAVMGWLSFDPATRQFSGTPLYQNIGVNNVQVIARDTSNTTVSTSFDITVQPVNDPPLVHTPIMTLIPLVDREAVEDSTFSLDLSASGIFSDEENDVLTLSATLSGGLPLPAWLSLSSTADPDIFNLSGLPGNDDVGSYNIRLRADDGNGGQASDTFEITVLNTNDAPVAEATIVSAYEKLDKTIDLLTSDMDPTHDLVTCTVETLPTGGDLFMTLDGLTPNLQITPAMLPLQVNNCQVIYNTQADFSDDVLDYDHFTFSAHDGMERSASDGTVTINIRNSNNAPTDISLTNNTIDENNSFNQLIGSFSATDLDVGETFLYSLVNGEGAEHNNEFIINASGELRAAVIFDYEAENVKHIRVQAMDSSGATYSKAFVINIQDVNEMVESIELSNNGVGEGLDPDQAVGYFDIVDPDEGDSWLVEITHIDGIPIGSYSPAPFVITEENGIPMLRTNIVLDVSTKVQYILSVQVTDSGGLVTNEAFTIIVYRMGVSMIFNDMTTVQTGSSVTVNVLANDLFSDVEISVNGENADWYFHRIVSPPLHGTAQLGSIIYSPDDGFVGADSIVYLACDNSYYCGYGILNIIVTESDNGESPGDSESGSDGGALPVIIPSSGFAPDRVTVLSGDADSHYDLYGNGLILAIPKLEVETEIVGVPINDQEWDITWLGNNAGYLEGSAYPTTNGNTVITGHVWNADGSEGIFLGLETLEYGDEIRISSNDLVYVYQVREVQQHLKPYQVNKIFEHETTDWLTLFTCQQYDEKNDTYNYRIFARAALVEVLQQ